MKYRFQSYEPKPIIENHLRMGLTNPRGERLYANSLYFTKNSKPFIGVMGEYHFSRANSEDWYSELCKMKAGGVDIASTYLFWIYHEEAEGKFDFTGDRDIRKFTLDAEKAGLYVFLRIGPWAHGECRNGGFPDWLLEKNCRLRSCDPAFLEKVRIWYSKIYEQLQGRFFDEGGNLIGIQFDNEVVDDAEYLQTLKTMAIDIGFRAPYYTVTGWNNAYGARIPLDEVLPMFGGYMDAPWACGADTQPLSRHYAFSAVRNDAAVGLDVIKQAPPDGWLLPYDRYPYATCELGPGLHATHHRRYIVKPMDAYAMSLVLLGCGNNLIGYYMYHGGENKIGRLSTLNESTATGYANDYPILNYDYQTALGQYGLANPQYGMLHMLHLFIHDFGDRLAPMQYVPSETEIRENDLSSLRYCLRTDGRSGFVFVNHYQRLAKLEDVFGAEIEALGVSFPTMDIKGELSFFLPVRMDLSGHELFCATAQPLCRQEDTYFFCAVDGIDPVYVFEDVALPTKAGKSSLLRYKDIRIVTLTNEEARFLRRLHGKLYLGENCDLYEADGEIKCIEPGSFAYGEWTSERFERREEKTNFTPARLTAADCPQPYQPKYQAELTLNEDVPLYWKKLSVSSDQGFVRLDFPCDAAQIYADRELVADQYSCGLPWTVPAKLLFGRECYAVYTEKRLDIYREE